MKVAWEELSWIGHDTYLGFADASASREGYFEAFQECSIDEGRVLDCTALGHAAIACNTQADDAVPLEVQRDAEGHICRARLCWTNDVDELDGTEGHWHRVGALVIDSGSCLAWDPRHHVTEGGHVFPVASGTYECDAFYTGGVGGDCLGLRITRADAALPERRMTDGT